MSSRTSSGSRSGSPEPSLYDGARRCRRCPRWNSPRPTQNGLPDLLGALRELFPSQRAAVYLHSQADLSVRDVAPRHGFDDRRGQGAPDRADDVASLELLGYGGRAVTERWRKKLEDIDQVAPRDDVYERAKAGPTLPESRSPMQRTSTRVATAIAAFVVFALAISLFVVPTLRLQADSSALSAGGQLLPLWPARTVEQVQALQDEADAGRADWALDPRQVGTRFGQAVLSWPDAWAGGVSSIAPTCGVLQGTYPNTASPEDPMRLRGRLKLTS